MATINTTDVLTNSVAAVNKSKYLLGADKRRVYDQLAVDYTQLGADGKTMDELMRSSSINIPFLSAMSPGTSTISQTTDVSAQALRDVLANVTTTSRWGLLQWSQQLEIQSYTNYTAAAFERVGKHRTETVELLAEAAACQGTWVERYAARASLDAGTSAHRVSDASFRKNQGMMRTLDIPGFETDDGDMVWSAIMHDYLFHDISESGNVDTIGIYQAKGIHLNFELGSIGPYRFVVTPHAKVFGGAGADCTAGTVATTLASDANALSTTFVTASDVSASVTFGLFWTIGTEETASTFHPTNERVRPLSASTTTITALGTAENSGLRYDHLSGVAVRNADSVYTMITGGPQSLVKVYATDVGEYGQIVGPRKAGSLDQFTHLGWKWYGGYALLAPNRILRGEYSTSYEA